jgi:hypothetical protein
MDLLSELSSVQYPIVVVPGKRHRKRKSELVCREGEIMWVDEVAPERLAELFHRYHEALESEPARTGSEERAGWKEISPQKKSRMVAAARLALLELESINKGRAKSHEYFAQPGEAEWGC